jgi:hypothetical protein
MPIGTVESNIVKPTFVHFPIGSKFTPRFIKACKINISAKYLIKKQILKKNLLIHILGPNLYDVFAMYLFVL